MPRRKTPRRPARTGRQEGARKVRGGKAATPAVLRTGRTGMGSSTHPDRAAARPLPVPNSASGRPLPPRAPERIQEILVRLNVLYPEVTCALQHKSAWELVVATILSAQSTDVRVNMVTPELFRKYPKIEDFARLQPQELEADIRSTGFFRNKSKSLVGAAKKILSDFGGKVPDEMDRLLT